MKLYTAMACAMTILVGGSLVNASDVYVKQSASSWTFGTSTVERTVALEDGRFVLKSFKDKVSGHELLPAGVESEEFSVTLENGEKVTSSSGGWRLLDTKKTTLDQDETQLDIVLERASLSVTKTYVIHPGSSIIREWVTFKNVGTGQLKIIEPSFLDIGMRLGDPKEMDFHWMTGGENQPESWRLKSKSISDEKSIKFDSYEPFARPKDPPVTPGNGIDAKILLNDTQIWPEKGWAYSANSYSNLTYDVKVDVKAGDKLVFLVNAHGESRFDLTDFDPLITYTGGESHRASSEFSSEQRKNGWQYQYLENGKLVDLTYDPNSKQWRNEKEGQNGLPIVNPHHMHPYEGQDAARVWTAPKSGKLEVSGSARNIGNGPDTDYHFRDGSTTYAPWYALYGKDTKQGVFIGWDYFGHWTSSFNLTPEGVVESKLTVAGHKQTLAPGESVSTPRSFIGLFRDDLDNAGNECLDWQYQYMWDYTRKDWFPATRFLGYWYKGTGWGRPGVGWLGGQPDWDSTFRKVFRTADLMRYVGGDVYHRDWGWWDRAGDWNGPDFRTTGNYLRKYDMGQLIYAFIYTVDPKSKVATEHPDWVIGSQLDMSKPEVVEYMKGQLDHFYKLWGTYEWRNDSGMMAPRDGDDTPLLKQDQGMRNVLKGFLDAHPDCAFQAVNGGGNYASYDYIRYSSTIQFTDGAAGLHSNYHTALLFPPDKTNHMPDVWDPNAFDKATFHGLLCCNFDLTGDTFDPVKLEETRTMVDIYHYLQKEGVVGRWCHVFRPIVTGDDPVMYFQRMSRDGKRGIIITKHAAPGKVTIRPKGLLPSEKYFVSYQETDGSETRTGADLMEQGITFEKLAPGELIYLNIPLHPGSKLDKEPPTAPTDAAKKKAENMGFPGVELTWKHAKDNNWISYYEVFRNGESIDKVAKGTYYFDHSAGADLAADYEIRTVDGAGNHSEKIAAHGPKATPSRIIDDGSGIQFNGNWNHATGVLPAHAGTISSSDQKGDYAEATFEGKKVLWFSKYGADCGKAEVSIDGKAIETVDTYSADDIYGVCLFRKEFPESGKHTMRITVTGEHSKNSTGALVHVDAIRVED